MSSVLRPDSPAAATAKLDASVVTPAPPLAPKKTHSLPSGRLEPEPVRANRGAAHGGAHHGLRHAARRERQSQELAGAGAHAANHQFGVGFRRIHHHRRGPIGAQRLHQVESDFRIAVQFDDDDVEVQLDELRAPGRDRDRKANGAELRMWTRRAHPRPPCGCALVARSAPPTGCSRRVRLFPDTWPSAIDCSPQSPINRPGLQTGEVSCVTRRSELTLRRRAFFAAVSISGPQWAKNDIRVPIAMAGA